MGSTTTLRCDTARTGTNPDFTINANPWRKYVSVDLGQATVGGNSYDRTVRAGVLVVENWLFNAGPHLGETRTLVLVATTTNEIYLLLRRRAARERRRGDAAVADAARRCADREPDTGSPNSATSGRCLGFAVRPWWIPPIAACSSSRCADDGTGKGHYSIFNIALDTGDITASQELVDRRRRRRARQFEGNLSDQRSGINLVGGWLWLGFAAFFAYDLEDYNGWVVAVNPDNLTQQLFQPMISV